MALYSISLIGIAFSVYLILYEKEPLSSHDNIDAKTMFLDSIPRMAKNKKILKLTMFTLGCRALYGALKEPILLKYIEHGINKVELTNIELGVMPLNMLYFWIANRMLRPGKLLNIFFWMTVVLGIALVSKLIILQIFQATGDRDACITRLIYASILGAIEDSRFVFYFAYIVAIIDKKIGATMITAIFVIWNLSNQIPETIGLKIIGHVDFSYYSWTIVCIYSIVLYLTYNLSHILDNTDPKEYLFD